MASRINNLRLKIKTLTTGATVPPTPKVANIRHQPTPKRAQQPQPTYWGWGVVSPLSWVEVVVRKQEAFLACATLESYLELVSTDIHEPSCIQCIVLYRCSYLLSSATTKTRRRFRVRLAGFMNLKKFSFEIKWPILTQKRCVFVIV